jgi:hypothetical protein
MIVRCRGIEECVMHTQQERYEGESGTEAPVVGEPEGESFILTETVWRVWSQVLMGKLKPFPDIKE